jgi:hypothetical protein
MGCTTAAEGPNRPHLRCIKAEQLTQLIHSHAGWHHQCHAQLNMVAWPLAATGVAANSKLCCCVGGHLGIAHQHPGATGTCLKVFRKSSRIMDAMRDRPTESLPCCLNHSHVRSRSNTSLHAPSVRPQVQTPSRHSPQHPRCDDPHQRYVIMERLNMVDGPSRELCLASPDDVYIQADLVTLTLLPPYRALWHTNRAGW